MSRLIISWLSLLARSSLFLITAPLLAVKYNESEVFFWYFCATIYSFIYIFDLGFSPNISRYISYTQGNTSLSHLNTPSLSDLFRASCFIYRTLATLVFTSLFAIGFIFQDKLLILEHNAHIWLFFTICSAIQIFGIKNSTTLNGFDKVSQVQKISFATATYQIFCVVILSMIGAKFSVLFLAFHSGTLIQSLMLSKHVRKVKLYFDSGESSKYKETLRTLFDASWKSGIGMLFSIGIYQLSGLYYSSAYDTKTATSYMITLQLSRALGTISQVPIYAFLPQMARKYSEGKLKEISDFFQFNLCVTISLYVAGAIAIIFLIPKILNLTSIPNFIPLGPTLYLMLIGVMAERYGAAYTQLYTLANKIVWHKINGLTFLLTVFLCFPAIYLFKNNGFPAAFATGNILILSWLPNIYSRKVFKGMYFTGDIAYFLCLTVALILLSIG